MKVLVMLLLACCFSMPIDIDYCTKNLSHLDECQWYTVCLERLFECGDRGYPISYGYKYCKRFNTAPFPDDVHNWVNQTTICLKGALVPIIEQRYHGKGIDCHHLRKRAFDSHPICYTQSGFCTLLKKRGLSQDANIIEVFLKVMELKDIIGSPLALKQIYQVASICFRQLIKH